MTNDNPPVTDYMGIIEEGKPIDIGWATVVLNPDHTLTRTCNGCGISATYPYTPGRQLGIIMHGEHCPMMAILEQDARR
jgi:hypothetical protein